MAGNSQEWLVLTTRYGKENQNPSKEDFNQAIEELGKDDPNAKTESDRADHATAWLRSGTETGPIYTISVNRDGTTSFSEFANHDADDPIVELTRQVSLEKALLLWVLLAARKPDKIKTELENDKPISQK